MLYASILVYFAIYSAAILMLWKRSGFDLLHPVVLFLTYLFVQIGASNLLYIQFDLPGELSLPLPEYSGRYIQATWLAIFATVLVALGALAVGRRQLSLAFGFPQIPALNMKILMLMVFPAGFAAFGVLMQINGGFSAFFENRESWRAGGLIGQGPLFFSATGLLNLAALLNLARAYSSDTPRFQKWLAMALLLLSVAPATLLGFRLSIFIPLFQGLAVVHYASKRIPVLRIAILSFVVFILFTAYGIHRELGGGAQSNMSASFLTEERPALLLAVLARSRGADVVATVIDTLDVTGEYDYGFESLVEWFTIWIPSSLWDDKPLHSNMRFGTQFFGPTLAATREGFDGHSGGVSATFVGETYWHMGLVGVLVMSCIWGVLGQLLHNALARERKSEFAVVVMAVCWSAFVMSAEYIQLFANGLLLNLGALALIMIAVFRPGRPPAYAGQGEGRKPLALSFRELPR